MAKGIFEDYISYVNRRKRTRKMLPSLIILGVFAIAYTAMIIALVYKNAVFAFVCSFIILICSILLIAKPLTTNEKMGILSWLETIAYFVVSVVLISIYVFSIAPENDKTTALTILSSCIGGLLTLYGVGVTIKYARIDKRIDELKRIRPNVIPISSKSWEKLSPDKKISFVVDINEESCDLKIAARNSKQLAFNPIRIANLGDSMVTIFGLYVNGCLIKFDYESVLIKNSFNEIVLDVKFELNEPIEEVIVVFEDIQRNVYFAKMRFDIETSKKSLLTKIDITSILDMRMIEENFDYTNL